MFKFVRGKVINRFYFNLIKKYQYGPFFIISESPELPWCTYLSTVKNQAQCIKPNVYYIL